MDEENTETIAKRVDETNNTAKATPPTKPANDAESGENGAMPAGPGEMGEMPEMNCEESESGEARWAAEVSRAAPHNKPLHQATMFFTQWHTFRLAQEA